jgi:hypothetical protein
VPAGARSLGTQPFIGSAAPTAAVQAYPVRATHRKTLTLASIGAVAQKHFASVEVGPEEVRASFGALEQLRVRVDGKNVAVDVRMNPKVDNAVAAETVARYNRFLEEVTGYTSKERARRMRKSAGE